MNGHDEISEQVSGLWVTSIWTPTMMPTLCVFFCSYNSQENRCLSLGFITKKVTLEGIHLKISMRLVIPIMFLHKVQTHKMIVKTANLKNVKKYQYQHFIVFNNCITKYFCGHV